MALPLEPVKLEFKFNNKSYYLLDRKPVKYVDESEDTNVDLLKRRCNADVVLKKDGWYHFCSEVEEAKVIWEELNGTRINYLKEEVYKPNPSYRMPNRQRKKKRKLTNKRRR